MIEIDVLGYVVASEDEWLYRWFGYDCVSPRSVRKALAKANDADVHLRINSYGGLTWAASEIYTDLRNYKGEVTADIVGLAASAAGIIAIAANVVRMAPTAEFMMHNPWSHTEGDYRDMEASGKSLRESRETIINAFALRCKGMSRSEIGAMLDAETWLSPQKAINAGIVDEMMFADSEEDAEPAAATETDGVDETTGSQGGTGARAAAQKIPNAYALKAQKAVWDLIAPGAACLSEAKAVLASTRTTEPDEPDVPIDQTELNDQAGSEMLRAQISALGAF